MSLLRTKSIEQSIQDTDDPDHKLRKDLGALDLVVFGVGVIIGAGIFVLTGTVAATNSGPALALSFLIAAVACGLAGLCYAEFASTVPVAGSAYTFSYATMGELVAWTIGWDLVLEFTIGSAALCVSFSGYLQSLLDGTALEVPTSLASASDGFIDLPAVVIALVVMGMLIKGTKFSSRVNQVVVAIKLAVVAAVIVVGVVYVDPSNWVPFIPESQPVPDSGGGFEQTPLITSLLGIEPAVFGLGGVIAGAAIVFFAFIGFDIVATTAEEAKNPQKDVPVGILGSLVVVTILYAAVSLVVTGVQDYRDIDPDDAAPLATAFSAAGVDWMGDLISVGACIGLVVVAMILMLGQCRVGVRDGPRRAAAAVDRQGAPDLRHAVPDHPDHRGGGRGHRRLRRPDDPGRPGQHRDALRVHPGQHRGRDPAPHPARPRAGLPRPLRCGSWRPLRNAHVPLPDAQPQGRHLDPVPGLDGDRLRRLLRLRAPTQPAEPGRAAEPVEREPTAT